MTFVVGSVLVWCMRAGFGLILSGVFWKVVPCVIQCGVEASVDLGGVLEVESEYDWAVLPCGQCCEGERCIVG